MNISRRLFVALTVALLTLTAGAHTYYFKPIDKTFDSLAARLNNLDFENRRNQITPRQTARLSDIARRSGNRQLRARAIYWHIRSVQMNTPASECIPDLEKARRLCSPGYDYDRALIEYQLAGNYDRVGRYLEAYNLLTGSIKTFKACGDQFFLGNANLLLAQLFLDINDPENARQPLEEARKAYAGAGFPLNRVYYFQALIGDPSQRMALYKKSLRHGGETDWGMTIQALNSISSIFLAAGQTDSAAHYNEQAAVLLSRKAPGNVLFTALVNIGRAKVLYARGRYDEVWTLLRREEQQNAHLLRGERFLANVYEMLWQVADKTKSRDDAYRYLRLYMQEYKRNEDEIHKQDVPKAHTREAIARRNDAISLLEKDARLNRQLLYMLVLTLAIIVLAGVALFIYMYQRYKIRKIENRELRNNLQQEALIYSVNRQNYERDIKQKECEISSSTLLLANKNEVLQQISEITKQYSDSGKIPVEYVRQVNSVIGDSLKNDDEWERFKLHFDSVHPNFFVKLKEASDELTENDLRLCAYIRIGMRAKQIAEMLSVSPDSINSNRYRLRKKLHLQRGESLDDFVRRV